MLRVFVAIPIRGEAEARLRRTLEQFRRLAPAVRWEAPEALHLTLQFVGAWPEPRLPELTAALASLPPPRFELQIEGLGAFPNCARPRVVWAGVQTSAPLQQLAKAVEHCLVPLGVAAESRPFQPHVSLARLRTPRDLGEVRNRLRLKAPPFGSCQVEGFTLYQTVPGAPAQTRYRPLQVFPAAPSTA